VLDLKAKSPVILQKLLGRRPSRWVRNPPAMDMLAEKTNNALSAADFIKELAAKKAVSSNIQTFGLTWVAGSACNALQVSMQKSKIKHESILTEMIYPNRTEILPVGYF
jgi:hypothetical protein